MPDRKTGTQAPLSADPEIRFPGESGEYRRARNHLLASEVELRRMLETVAAQRRALPRGGAVPEDYRFEEADRGGEVSFSELFAPSKDTLVIYSFMFPRSPSDTRPGPVSGETAGLALTEMPCPSCTSILDGLDGAAPHLAQRLNLAVSRNRSPNGSTPSPASAAGGTCGSSPRAAPRTTATTTPRRPRASSSRSSTYSSATARRFDTRGLVNCSLPPATRARRPVTWT
jgi:Bacterial protein of unknown function (DUF899)